MQADRQLIDAISPPPRRIVPDVSVVIVSFNTEAMLRSCLRHLILALKGIEAEVIVVDNNSHDGSAAMVAREFPLVRLIRSPENVGFAAANNLGFTRATGAYLVALNSDAFIQPDGIRLAVASMQADSAVGVGGARLIGADGKWQPSVRMFPSILNDFLMFTGLAARFRKSRFLGRADHTWADPRVPADADWVPGAFMILRREALDKTGFFDESFFFYYEEVDLCRRIKDAGFRVRYWPDVIVVHLEGGSSPGKEADKSPQSFPERRTTVWRLRSQFLYYRKHHGGAARLAMWSERTWHKLRMARNALRGATGRAKFDESRAMIAVIDQVWRATRGGRLAPPRPW